MGKSLIEYLNQKNLKNLSEVELVKELVESLTIYDALIRKYSLGTMELPEQKDNLDLGVKIQELRFYTDEEHTFLRMHTSNILQQIRKRFGLSERGYRELKEDIDNNKLLMGSPYSTYHRKD